MERNIFSMALREKRLSRDSLMKKGGEGGKGRPEMITVKE